VDENERQRRREALNVVRNLVHSQVMVADQGSLGKALVRYLQGSHEEDFVSYLMSERMLDEGAASELRNNTASIDLGDPLDVTRTLRDLGAVYAPISAEEDSEDDDEVEATLPDTQPLPDPKTLGVVGRKSVLYSEGTLGQKVRALSEERTQTATVHAQPGGGDRYQTQRLLGLGGMGEVYEVVDVDLNRHVALKRIRKDRQDDEALTRFLLEAQVTAQLEHPNIVPVHDLGKLSSGEPFFVMKQVQGQSLRDVIRAIARGDKEMSEHYHRTRLAIIFLHIVEAMEYAHARGVVHCDLKPENILIGRHGEVLVTDWGLAHLLGAARTPDVVPVAVSPGVREYDSVGGTLLYMAPEQLTSRDVDQRADIYALGAILYEMLTLLPPREAADPGMMLVEAFTTPLVPPRERAPDRQISVELDAVCRRCLEPRAADRYDSADQLREAMEAYLTGARRRETARERFAEGEAAWSRREALKKERDVVVAALEKIRPAVKPYDGEAKKRPLWELEQRLYDTDIAVEEALAEAIDGWSQAVGIDSGFVPAADRLADVHLELFLRAEDEGDRRQMHFHRRQVERHHRGRHAEVLGGRGRVVIRPRTPNVMVEGLRLVEKGKRIEEAEPLVLERGSVVDTTLPMGSYLFTLRAAGKKTARLPVHVGRGGAVELEPELVDEELVPRGFVHVPAGPFIYGGDKEALNAGPRETRHLDDFLIASTSVTNEEYLAFLNAMAKDSPHLAEGHVPRNKAEGGYLWPASPDGSYALPKHDADGNFVHPRAPVMGVSHVDAQAYAAWRAEQEGRPYRLPSEEEWEKAARGADGRFFPWGNGFDPTFCKMANSRPGRPAPEPVGSFPVDVSVFGMKDGAGAIREWTDSFYDDNHETRVLRGGAWYFNPAYCRVAFRHGYLPHIVFTNFGIRLALSVT
jgi:serine/threonine-protein kinase